MSEGKATRAELAEAVRELREEVARLRAERAAHTCHGHALCFSHHHCNWGHCNCWITHAYYTTLPNISISPYQVTCGSTTNVSSSGFVSTGSGYNPAITSYTVTN